MRSAPSDVTTISAPLMQLETSSRPPARLATAKRGHKSTRQPSFALEATALEYGLAPPACWGKDSSHNKCALYAQSLAAAVLDQLEDFEAELQKAIADDLARDAAMLEQIIALEEEILMSADTAE